MRQILLLLAVVTEKALPFPYKCRVFFYKKEDEESNCFPRLFVSANFSYQFQVDSYVATE